MLDVRKQYIWYIRGSIVRCKRYKYMDWKFGRWTVVSKDVKIDMQIYKTTQHCNIQWLPVKNNLRDKKSENGTITCKGMNIEIFLCAIAFSCRGLLEPNARSKPFFFFFLKQLMSIFSRQENRKYVNKMKIEHVLMKTWNPIIYMIWQCLLNLLLRKLMWIYHHHHQTYSTMILRFSWLCLTPQFNLV